MKWMFTLALLIPSAAYSANLSRANLYDCQQGNLQVSLATSSLIGEPQLHLTGNTVAGYVFSQTELSVTKMGYMASVFVTNVSDISVDYSFIVPEVMAERGSTTKVSAHLIRTTVRRLVDPETLPGPIQTNTVTRLNCTASVVDF